MPDSGAAPDRFQVKLSESSQQRKRQVLTQIRSTSASRTKGFEKKFTKACSCFEMACWVTCYMVCREEGSSTVILTTSEQGLAFTALTPGPPIASLFSRFKRKSHEHHELTAGLFCPPHHHRNLLFQRGNSLSVTRFTSQNTQVKSVFSLLTFFFFQPLSLSLFLALSLYFLTDGALFHPYLVQSVDI